MTIRYYSYWNEALGRTEDKEWFSYFTLLGWDINQVSVGWGRGWRICLIIFNFEIDIII